jgi:HAD superfamily hydrolase (TIGR01549 family)
MRTVFFDLDDTILDSTPISNRIFFKIKNLVDPSLDDIEFLKTFRTIARKNLYKYADYPINDLIGLAPVDLLMVSDDYELADIPKLKREIARDLKEVYKVDFNEDEFYKEILNMRYDYSVKIPGMMELVRELRSEGYVTGLITNGASEVQQAKIDAANIRDDFDYIFVSGEYMVGKPDLKFYKIILDESHAASKDSVMVGDNIRNDCLAALAMGMHAIHFGEESSNYAMTNAKNAEEVRREIYKYFNSL